MDKKSIVNDLYQAAVISVLPLITQCWVKILKIASPSIQKFDLEDTRSWSQL